MKVIETAIPGVLIIEPKIFGDARGFFMETYQRERYADHGIPPDLVQDNLSYSRHGVLRGLHVQHPHAQGKLVQVFRGEVFDVAVDIRRGSPTFGRWAGALLSGENQAASSGSRRVSPTASASRARTLCSLTSAPITIIRRRSSQFVGMILISASDGPLTARPSCRRRTWAPRF